jgi:SPP1 family predicted phage head-tail adaptor
MSATAIGKKRKQITVEERGSTANSFGQPGEVWSTVASLWASVETLTGREMQAAQQVRAETTVRVKIRGRAFAVTALHRIDYNGRKLKILAAYDPEELGRETWIECAEWPGAESGE